MLFSQRMGHTEVRTVVQVESIDAALRNKLWSLVHLCLDNDSHSMHLSPLGEFYTNFYMNFFQRPLDRVPDYVSHANNEIREYFFEEEWVKPYDVLEFILNALPKNRIGFDPFAAANRILEEYLSGYRFVHKQLVPITDDSHINAIEKALETSLTGVRAHLAKSLTLLGDRDNPDPANSIKEAISAVESLCASIIGRRATLGEALKRLEEAGVKLHPALKDSWVKLYGYTSDAQGIRHSGQLESTATADEALYFLVSSSAFIGLLTTMATGAGIDLQPVT